MSRCTDAICTCPDPFDGRHPLDVDAGSWDPDEEAYWDAIDRLVDADEDRDFEALAQASRAHRDRRGA